MNAPRGLALRLSAVVAAAVAVGACTGACPTATPAVTPVSGAEETSAVATDALPTLPGVIDACAIVPKADAEFLAGTPLGDGVAGNPLDPSCIYTGPVTGPTGQVSVFTGDGAKKTYDIDVALHHEFSDVKGIGDEAHEEANAIFVRKGAVWIAIELVRLNDSAENRQPLEEVAKRAVGRLP